ncbi:protein suppressor of forked [Diaphorina citri]|uniref:Protein suppressor of forked n=1 Tax=Diaphorina citri TaxID=121845 RepID=A0A3Q0J7E6_DIACI|nr:protein suppressor of forked [Diaphorina citri]
MMFPQNICIAQLLALMMFPQNICIARLLALMMFPQNICIAQLLALMMFPQNICIAQLLALMMFPQNICIAQLLALMMFIQNICIAQLLALMMFPQNICIAQLLALMMFSQNIGIAQLLALMMFPQNICIAQLLVLMMFPQNICIAQLLALMMFPQNICIAQLPEEEWANEKLRRAQSAINENPWDIEAWGILIREAQTRWINEVRPFFEQLVTTYPTTGRYWKIYIEQEMRSRNFERVEKLFQRCLIKVLNIDLWKLYLAYVKETKASLVTFKEKMAQAYDFALDKIGMDLHSFPIWNDYINFLKGVEAVGSYAENQKITAVRKVCQRGVVNPMQNIELLWKDYIAYEQSINPIIAEKIILERSREYMNARRVAKEFEVNTRGLNKNLPCIPPTGHAEEIKQTISPLSFKRAREDEKSSYQVYISAALMEYYCSKDKNIAFRIFELGLKKFSHIPEYVMNYIDYLSHLNEDNNTRVLFERILSSDCLSPDKSVEVWNRFLEFESNIGDLASIVKVEKRRSAVLTKMAEFEGKDTAQLVDRYKFLDLYPCSPAELKSIGYTEVTKSAMKAGTTAGTAGSTALFSSQAGLDGLDEERKGKTLVRPDLTQMIPYKPKPNAWRGEHLLPDGLDEERKGKTLVRPDLTQMIPYKPKPNVIFIPGLSFSSQAGLDDLDEERKGKTLVRPDLTQMIPYKPKPNAWRGEHLLPGGGFPAPPAVAQLLSILPPPGCFHGPFVGVDPLLDLILGLKLPSQAPRPVPSDDPALQAENAKLFDLAASVTWSEQTDLGGAGGGGGMKRKKKMGDESEEEEEGLQVPANDLYRLRQKKRVSKG